MSSFGVYHEYQGTPSCVPNEDVDPNYLSDSLITMNATIPVVPDLGIFTNVATLNFLHWFWNCGNLKSIADQGHSVNEVFQSSEVLLYHIDHLKKTLKTSQKSIHNHRVS